MLSRRITSLLLIAIILLVTSNVQAQNPELTKYNGYGRDDISSQTGRYWVFFGDKGGSDRLNQITLNDSSLPLSERSINRRIMRAQQESVTIYDLPVSSDYLRAIKDRGIDIRIVSRYLNAASVDADEAQLEWLDGQDDVVEIRPVVRFKRTPPVFEPEISLAPMFPTDDWDLDYGTSVGQLQLMRVPQLHNEGFTGDGVIIAIFDTGFDMDHPVVTDMDILAAYDFIHDDADVDDDDVGEQRHGTEVLTAAGAAVPGQLYGPAYGATFVLAKTEDKYGEYQQEEDFYIAALEWADSIGCDIVSASIGYSDWYEFSDLDGDTSPLTVACDIAASFGITVVNAAGNERHGFGHIVVPSDGHSVIAVGAVNSDGDLMSFSSPGPTYDGRIKPDICSQGSGATAAIPDGGFTQLFGGTSAATPLAAGAIALLLEMHPSWGQIDVRSAIWATGQQKNDLSYPNNDYGYGVIDAAAAAGLFRSVAKITACPNPFDESVTFLFPSKTSGGQSFYVFTIDGAKVFEKELSPGSAFYRWNGKNSADREVAAGMYLVKFTGFDSSELLKILKVN